LFLSYKFPNYSRNRKKEKNDNMKKENVIYNNNDLFLEILMFSSELLKKPDLLDENSLHTYECSSIFIAIFRISLGKIACQLTIKMNPFLAFFPIFRELGNPRWTIIFEIFSRSGIPGKESKCEYHNLHQSKTKK